MPYPGPVVSTGQTGLAEGDIERLSLWIAQGANIPPSCAMVEETTCPQ